MGPGVPWRQRIRPVATAGLLAGAIMLALSEISGLGLGWIGNLATPGTVRSWLAPATGIGMGLTSVAHLVGLGVSQGGVLSVTRLLGLAGAAGASAYLLWHSDRIGGLQALGLSLLLFVVLGPVVQPWYLTWGIILLAPVAEGRLRSVLIGLSVASPFIGLPGGRTLLDQLIHANPLAVAGRARGAAGGPGGADRPLVDLLAGHRAGDGPAGGRLDQAAGARPRRASGRACGRPRARPRPARSRRPGGGRWRPRCGPRSGR